MKKLFLTLIMCMTAFFAACDQQNNAPSAGTEPTVKEGVDPIADSEVAVIELVDGDAFPPITIELYSNIAPKMVERFKTLAKEGVYNGLKFHRVTPDVIQSGDPNSIDNDPSDDGKGSSKLPNVQAEFSDIKYVPGIVGAARGPDFDSANSQFFIMKTTQPGFDRKYTAFGKVIEGMGSVRTIGGVPVNGDRPIGEIRIKTIKIEEKK